MRRDAEKKTWKDPSASGLAAGSKPRARDGRLQGFFSSLGPAVYVRFSYFLDDFFIFYYL